MKRYVSIAVALFMLISLLAGCGAQKGDESVKSSQSNAAGSSAESTAEQTQAATEEALSGELEVVMGATYLSESMFDALFEGFQKAYPNIKLKKEVNNKVNDLLVPRIASGEWPDIFGAYLPNTNDLINEGQILETDEWLNTKAFDSDKTVLETLVPGCEDSSNLNGKRYGIALSPAFAGIVVNDTLFKKNGWKIPSNYTELLDVSEKIKGSKILPLGYSVTDGNRLEMCMWLNMLYEYGNKLYEGGGEKLFLDLDNLVPGVWKSEPVIAANKGIKELLDKGIIDKNGLGLNGSTSQAEFLMGKSAMVTSGYWFQMEMKDQIPAGTELSIIPFPANSDSKQMMNGWYNSIMAYANTKHKAETYAFLSYFVSHEFQKKCATEGGLTLVANKQVMDEMKESPDTDYFTKSVISCAVNPNIKVLQSAYQWWYWDALRKPLQDGLVGIMNDQTTPEKLAAELEANAEKLRKDDTVKKYIH